MSKFLDHMFSPSLGWPMLYIGVILLLSTPIVRIQKYLMSLGIFIFPMFQGLLFIFMSLPILYLSNKNKTLHKKNQYEVKNRDTLSTGIFDKEEELISLKNDIDKAWQELNFMKAEVEKAEAEQEQYQQENTALQAELEKARAELEQARQAEGVNPRSRNTYLKVIAALANRNGKIDLHERGAAVTISRATENFGFPVSEDTTRKIIKEIEELQK